MQDLSALLLVGNGVLAWVAFLTLGVVALRVLGTRLRAAGVEMGSTENDHCGTVLGLDVPAEDTTPGDTSPNAETVLCPNCGTRNRADFRHCRECVSRLGDDSLDLRGRTHNA